MVAVDRVVSDWDLRRRSKNANIIFAKRVEIGPVLGPKPWHDAMLTILPGGSDNQHWGQPTGGARVWQQNQMRLSKLYPEHFGTISKKFSAP